MHTDDEQKRLYVNNKGQERKSEWEDMPNVGRRVDLSCLEWSKTNALECNGVRVTSSQGIFNSYNWPDYVYPHGTYHFANSPTSYILAWLFDQSFDNDIEHFFMVNNAETTLTIDLQQEEFINRVRVYPNPQYPTRFKVLFYFRDIQRRSQKSMSNILHDVINSRST